MLNLWYLGRYLFYFLFCFYQNHKAFLRVYSRYERSFAYMFSYFWSVASCSLEERSPLFLFILRTAWFVDNNHVEKQTDRRIPIELSSEIVTAGGAAQTRRGEREREPRTYGVRNIREYIPMFYPFLPYIKTLENLHQPRPTSQFTWRWRFYCQF